MKILTKTHVIYLKRKLRTYKIKIQVEKVWFVTKKMEKFNFEKKNFKGGTLWSRNGRKKKFPFFKFSKFFFEKWLQWDVANVDRNKVMKFELISSIHGEITRDHLPRGVQNFWKNALKPKSRIFTIYACLYTVECYIAQLPRLMNVDFCQRL